MALVRLLRHLHRIVVVGALAAAALGGLMFYWAFRSWQWQWHEGASYSYQLRTELTSEGEPGTARSIDEQRIDLYCLSAYGDVAVLSRAQDGQDRLRLLRLEPDGRAQAFEDAPGSSQAALTPLPERSQAFGFFDFNLLPLPQDPRQSWTVRLRYGLPPPDAEGRHPEVEAQVRRMKGGPNPTFELRIERLEWIASQPSAHFRAIADLVCRYRYSGSKGVVEWAELECRYGIEGTDRPRYFHIKSELQLEHASQEAPSLAVRDLALATATAQQRPIDAQSRAILSRLAQAATGLPRLQSLAARLAGDATLPPPVAQESGSWFVQVASVPRARRAQAEAAVQALRARKLPAQLRVNSGQVQIVVGPYPAQSPGQLNLVRSACRSPDAFWTR